MQYFYGPSRGSSRGYIASTGPAWSTVTYWSAIVPAPRPPASQRATFSVWPPPKTPAPFWPNLRAYWGRG